MLTAAKVPQAGHPLKGATSPFLSEAMRRPQRPVSSLGRHCMNCRDLLTNPLAAARTPEYPANPPTRSPYADHRPPPAAAERSVYPTWRNRSAPSVTSVARLAWLAAAPSLPRQPSAEQPAPPACRGPSRPP